MTVETVVDRSRPYLTIGEVAAELRCSEPTVRRLVRDGELGAVRVRSAVRVPRARLDEYLAGNGYPCGGDDSGGAA